METKKQEDKEREKSKDFVWKLFDSIIENVVSVFK